MRDKKKRQKINHQTVAPGIDPEDSYGEKTTPAEVKKVNIRP